MAKRLTLDPVAPLVIGLADPGMTPLLRSGLGGLAASLRSMLLAENRKASWPSPVQLGSGRATVEPQRITISFERGRPEAVLKALFAGAFRIRKPYGLIDLPGTYDSTAPPLDTVRVALQLGLKRTFLQHGKTTKKSGGETLRTFELDGRQVAVAVQAYSAFAHQDAWKKVATAQARGAVELAGWAYPGAAQRHIAFGQTKIEYGPGQALSALFALVGCVCHPVARGSAGALVIPEPADLVRFAEVRPLLTPGKLADAYVTGASDAVLALHLALRMDQASHRKAALATAHGVTLRTTPWARQQKTRVATLSRESFPDEVLDLYDEVRRTLPTTIRILEPAKAKKKATKAGDDEEAAGGFFAAASALRTFLTDNLATGQRWFAGFATATTAEKKPRFIHYYRSTDNRGALYASEKRGLIAMLPHVHPAENALIESVHIALRQRFGAIAKESRDNPAAMRNRWQSERDRWRFAFAGAKTLDQTRAALADLWSRGGSNRELRARWKGILPLLATDQWRVARDLALVALASYEGTGGEAASDPEQD